MAAKMETRKCGYCNSTTSHVICKQCGVGYHTGCKKWTGKPWSTFNKCPSCGGSST